MKKIYVSSEEKKEIAIVNDSYISMRSIKVISEVCCYITGEENR